MLDDVFAAPADVREALLNTTLRQVRRRRRFHRARSRAGIFAVLVLFAILVWPKNAKQTPIAIAPPIKKAVEQNYSLVSTEPLPAHSIVQTRSFGMPEIISSHATVEIVQTTMGDYHSINDEQLLALMAAHPAMLVRTGPHSEELFFVNPQDAKGFPLN